MKHRTTLLFWVFVGVIGALLISACTARLAQPGASAQSDRALATEAPVAGSRGPEGTPPGFPTVVVEAVVTDPAVVALLAGLEARGFATERLDASRVELLNDAPGQGYRLGDGWLHLHVYAEALAAEAAAARIKAAMPLPLVDWVAPPHFFQCDRLVTLYLGVDETIIGAMSELCAPPFYTTDLRPADPGPTPEPLTSIEAALARLLELGEPAHATGAPEVRWRVDLESGVALLYTYEAVQAEQPVQVTRFSYLDWRDPVWYPDGDHIHVVGAETAPAPIQFLIGTYVVNGGLDTPELPDRVTFAGGLVNDPAVVSVRVTFSDGSQAVVPVVNRAYLAARLDVDQVTAIEALDQAGQILAEMPPGK